MPVVSNGPTEGIQVWEATVSSLPGMHALSQTFTWLVACDCVREPIIIIRSSPAREMAEELPMRCQDKDIMMYT
jgi:hypothetical protein